MPGSALAFTLRLSAILAACWVGLPPAAAERIPFGPIPFGPIHGSPRYGSPWHGWSRHAVPRRTARRPAAPPTPAALPQEPATPTETTTSFRDQPMQLRIVRDGRPGCGDSCGEWIAAEGRIVPGTGEAFADVMRKLGGRRLPVFIDSGGGAVEDAITIGKLIRDRQLDVAIAESIPNCDGCGPDSAVPRSPGAVCASVCVMVLAAGTGRVGGLATHIGVHQMSVRVIRFVKRRVLPVCYRADCMRRGPGQPSLDEQTMSTTTFTEPASRETDDRVARYFDEMGIGAGLMPMMLSTPSTSIRWLTHTEERNTRLITASTGGEDLLAQQHRALAAPEPKTAEVAATSGGIVTGLASQKAMGGDAGEPHMGTVAWSLQTLQLGRTALVAEVEIPSTGLTLTLRVAPDGGAVGAPLYVDAGFRSDGGSIKGVERVWPLHAGPVEVTGSPRANGRMAWRLRLNGSASTLLATPPAKLGVRLLHGRLMDLTFEAPDRLAALIAQAERDWADGAGAKAASAR